MKMFQNALGFARGLVSLIAMMLIFGLVVFLGIGVVERTKEAWLSDWPLMVRDAGVALVAKYMEGEPVPFDADYLPPGQVITEEFGSYADSPWLLREMRNILPYYVSEGLTAEQRNPTIVAFTMFEGGSSFVLGGMADEISTGDRGQTVARILLNERYAFSANYAAHIDDSWNDARRALGTLVHEGIHVQGGAFTQPPAVDALVSACIKTQNYRSPECETMRSVAARESVFLESKTEAATWEVLAAMCQNGDDLACQSFWGELGGRVRQSLSSRMYQHGLGWFFERFADVFLRDAKERRIAAHYLRFWSGHMQERADLQAKYGLRPWEVYFIPGLFGGQFSTELLGPEGIYTVGNVTLTGHVVLSVKFDDSQAMFGPLLRAWVGLFQLGRPWAQDK